MKHLLLILLLMPVLALAGDPHLVEPGTNTTTSTTTEVTITRADGYGLMGLSSSGLVFDCCRPDALQWAVAGAFVSGGNQSVAAGLATNMGPVLLNVRFTAVLGPSESEDDYAVIVGGSGAFK